MNQFPPLLAVTLLLTLLNSSYAAVAAPAVPLGGSVTAQGASFRVWAPSASAVSVMGDSPNWQETPLVAEGAGSGIWSGQVPGARAGDHYAYSITASGGAGSAQVTRMDPEGRQVDQNAGQNSWSVLVDPSTYAWQSTAFVRAPLQSAVIYELHIGSFNPGSPTAWGTYQSVTAEMDYLANLGVNYIELLPVHESATQFDWGYGPSLPNTVENSYGAPDDLRKLVDTAHSRGIGVLLDVVHNHYSSGTALKCFDGNCGASNNGNGQYFYIGQQGTTPWGPRPNYADAHVRDFITDDISRYLSEYHVDGFRWDAVPYITNFLAIKTSILDNPNPDGTSLLQSINQLTHASAGRLSIAEFFGAPGSATQPPSAGGLGFDSHWNGFFSVVQAVTESSPSTINIATVAASLAGSTERVVFTESHDEVGHPPAQIRIPARIDPANPGSLAARKRSLLAAAVMMTSPGVPMLFQGQEFLESQTFLFPKGTPLDWSKAVTFSGILKAYRDMISLRKNSGGKTAPLLGANIQVYHQNENAKVLAFRRWNTGSSHQVVVLANFGAQSFTSYEIGLPISGEWSVLFTSDDRSYSPDFGGAPVLRSFTASANGYDGLPNSTTLELAPFTAVVFAN